MHVELKRKAEFIAALKDYRPAPEVLGVLAQSPLVIFMGVAGGGRNTIINHLLGTGGYKFIVSDTTRPPKNRDGALEVHGVNYYFRNEEDVLRDLRDGNFLEAELIHNQQVSGISVRELTDAAKSNKIPINEVEFGGAMNILNIKPDTKVFCIVPPSYEEWMRRLNTREAMTELEFNNRINTALKVLETGLSEDRITFVINESSKESAAMIDHIVRGGSADDHHREARGVASTILRDVRAHRAI